MYLQDIKIDAATIESLLSSYRVLSIQEIEELTGYTEKFIFMAMGWLAKENKIQLSEKQGFLYAELKQSNYTEMYF